MKALSILQPWASAIALGPKTIENRGWTPSSSMLGVRIAIHASKGWDKFGLGAIKQKLGSEMELKQHKWITSYPQQAVIGVARIAGWVSLDHPKKDVATSHIRAQLLQDPWFEGPIGIVLTDVLALPKPIACRGLLNFWPIPSDVEAQIRTEVARLEGVRKHA